MYTLIRRRGLSTSIFHPHYRLFRAQQDWLRAAAKKHHVRILDFGAGNSPCRELFHCEQYIKVDVEQNARGDIDFILSPDSPRTPYPDGHFDLVLCLDVLEHVYDDAAVIGELFRLLRPGGAAFISTPFMYREHEYPHDRRRFTSTGIREALLRAGFGEVRVEKFGNAWQVLSDTWFGSVYTNRQGPKLPLHARLSRKLYRVFLLPILNTTLFTRRNWDGDNSVYVELFVRAEKEGNI